MRHKPVRGADRPTDPAAGAAPKARVNLQTPDPGAADRRGGRYRPPGAPVWGGFPVCSARRRPWARVNLQRARVDLQTWARVNLQTASGRPGAKKFRGAGQPTDRARVNLQRNAGRPTGRGSTYRPKNGRVRPTAFSASGRSCSTFPARSRRPLGHPRARPVSRSRPCNGFAAAPSGALTQKTERQLGLSVIRCRSR